MLDVSSTRARINDWIRSPAFDAHFNSIVKPSIWPFIIGGVMMLTIVGIPVGIGLIIAGVRKNSARSAARREAHTAYAQHQPILCGIVIANRQLLRTKGAVAPALLVGGFGPQDESALDDIARVAIQIGELYGDDPSSQPPELQEACRLVNDDS